MLAGIAFHLCDGFLSSTCSASVLPGLAIFRLRGCICFVGHWPALTPFPLISHVDFFSYVGVGEASRWVGLEWACSRWKARV